MAQEFTIKSTAIEDKINQLLPSQGGAGAGIDFSASTMVIPIVDLTETAEGSALRQDLQTSLSLTSVTSFSVLNTTTTLINTTGYYRVFGNAEIQGSGVISFTLTDGFTSKILTRFIGGSGASTNQGNNLFDFNVFLEAGESLTCTSTSNVVLGRGVTRQIADINGNLINP